MKREEMYLKIEEYLNGSITADQKELFEIELKNNSELRKEVSVLRAVNKHLNKNEWQEISGDQFPEKKELDTYFKSEEAQSLKKKLRQIQYDYKPKKQKAYYKYVSVAATIAASFLILFVIHHTNNKKTYEELYTEHYNKKDLPSFVTRGTNKSSLDQGITAFQNQEFKKALSLFEKHVKQVDSVNPLIYSYIGITHLQLNNTEKALLSFDKLLNSDSIDRSKALWYKSLVFLKIKDSNQLKATLNLLIKQPSKYKYGEAQKILREI